MKKSKFKFFGLSFLFALLLTFSVDVNAQTDAALVASFTSYPAGTFEEEASLLTLQAELDGMPKGQTITAEQQYYFLITIDIKRDNISVEESLMNNLSTISTEFNYSISELETLYQNTVDKL